ncbi:TRDC protein, partial [Ramphastos sulfuratus]|nr:TRDC protein [Ramphastos sulfuratus]
MKSKDVGEGAGKAACLARNSNTKSITLEMSPNEVVYEQSPPILTSEGLYNAVKVVSVAEGTEVTCKANFNGNTLTESTASTTGTDSWPCSLPSFLSHQADSRVEKVNMLSMAVLALRVLLAKTIAFNTLMSIKLFLF